MMATDPCLGASGTCAGHGTISSGLCRPSGVLGRSEAALVWRLLGRGQVVRRLTLDQEIGGSNPPAPASPCSVDSDMLTAWVLCPGRHTVGVEQRRLTTACITPRRLAPPM